MPDPRTIAIENLIQDYHAADKDMTEANVEAAFVARLFAILGWAADDPTVWNRQVFVRGGGFADVGLQIQHKPVLLLEAKRFGKLKGLAKAVQAALFGEDVVLSQADRQRAGIDRTPEEKQAMRYARAQEVPWDSLATNYVLRGTVLVGDEPKLRIYQRLPAQAGAITYRMEEFETSYDRSATPESFAESNYSAAPPAQVTMDSICGFGLPKGSLSLPPDLQSGGLTAGLQIQPEQG